MEKYEFDIRKCAECDGSVQSFILSDREGLQRYLECRASDDTGFKIFYTVYRREVGTFEWEAVVDLTKLSAAMAVAGKLESIEELKEVYGA